MWKAARKTHILDTGGEHGESQINQIREKTNTRMRQSYLIFNSVDLSTDIAHTPDATM